MKEFNTWIFQENEVKTHNIEIIRERPFYIGILIFLIGVALYLLDSAYAVHFLVIAYLLLIVGQILTSGRRPSIGHRPVALKLTPDAIYIGNDRLEIKKKSDMEITIVGYKGQLIPRRVAFYHAHNGNENRIKIRSSTGTTELRFVLESEHHRDKLLKFCVDNDLNFWDPTKIFP